MRQGVKHEPSEHTRKQVMLLSSSGLNQDRVAEILDISDETLRKYYSHEFKHGLQLVLQTARQKLFKFVENGELNPENLRAAIFILERLGEYKHTTQLTDLGVQLAGAKVTLAEKLRVALGDDPSPDE